MGTRRMKITVYGVPVDISENRMGAFFAGYRPIKNVLQHKQVWNCNRGYGVASNTDPAGFWRNLNRIGMPWETDVGGGGGWAQTILLVLRSLGAQGQSMPHQKLTASTPPSDMSRNNSNTNSSTTVAAKEKVPEGEWQNVKRRKTKNTPSPQKQNILSPKKQRQSQERPKEAQEQTKKLQEK